LRLPDCLCAFGILWAVLVSALLSAHADAATVAPAGAPVSVTLGVPMAQRFLPSGVSEVTTSDGTRCVASATIDITRSDYRAADGTSVAFAPARRSVAASVQAFAAKPVVERLAGRAGDAPHFRVQLKYSPVPGTPVWLTIGDAAPVDVAAMLEPSTDSLLLTGTMAADLARGFAAKQAVHLVAVSVGTAWTVTDTLPAPDLAALADCLADIDPGPDPGHRTDAPILPLVSLEFTAAPDPATRMPPEALRVCAMMPTDLRLYQGRIRATTGFFAQTGHLLVAFARDGTPARVYVPGVFDAKVTGTAPGEAWVEHAADSNVPSAPNKVKGCLGVALAELCTYPVPEEADTWVMRPCGIRQLDPGLSGHNLFSSTMSEWPGTPPKGGPPPGPTLSDDCRRRSCGCCKPPPGPHQSPHVSPVPLPATWWMLLASLGGLAVLRRRRGGSGSGLVVARAKHRGQITGARLSGPDYQD
jgi:hypothetical protein